MRLWVLTVVMCVGMGWQCVAQITLSEYCAAVEEYNHHLLSAEAAAEGAEADMRRAHREYLPEVAFDGSASYDFHASDVGRPWGWTARIDVAQPVYHGGRVRAEAQQAELALGIAQSDLEAVHIEVVYLAEHAYWTLSRAEAYYRAMVDYLRIVGSLRDVVARRYEEGYSPKSDLLQLDSRLSDARYQLSSAQQSRLVALHNFNNMRGVEPTMEVELASSILDSMAMPRRLAVAEILDHRPDYRSACLSVESSRWAIRVAQSEFLPRVDVGLYGALQPETPHLRGGALRLDGGVFVSFNSPIFHFGERREAARSARSAYARTELACAELADEIALEESNSWTNLLSTRERVEATRRNLTIAEENLEISTYSYHEGLVTILDVLQAQLSWLQIYTNAINAQYDHAVACSAYRYVTSTAVY